MKLTYQDLLEKMTNMEMLAIPPEKGEMGGNFSSYDRNSSYDPSTDTYSQWGANRDCDGYIRMEKDRLVAFEMEGPGVIWRIWSAIHRRGTSESIQRMSKKRKWICHFENCLRDMPMMKAEWSGQLIFPN